MIERREERNRRIMKGRRAMMDIYIQRYNTMVVYLCKRVNKKDRIFEELLLVSIEYSTTAVLSINYYSYKYLCMWCVKERSSINTL